MAGEEREIRMGETMESVASPTNSQQTGTIFNDLILFFNLFSLIN